MKKWIQVTVVAVCLVSSASAIADNDLAIQSSAPCYAAGSQVTVNVVLDNVTAEVLGGLFYIQYDNAKLGFVSIEPGDLPFEVDGPETVDELTGTISYTTTVGTPDVGDPEGYTGTGPVNMAVMTFEILTGVCSEEELVVFYEPGFPFTTRLTQPSPSGTGAIPLYADTKTDMATVSFLMSLPTLPPQAQITENADPGVCSWLPEQGDIVPPVSQDACGTALIPSGTRNDGMSLDAAYPVGQTIITWSVVDCAGQTATTDQVVEVLDSEAPAIQNCPEDITVLADAGSCGAVVDWIEPTATDNCGTVTVVSTHSPGDMFPAGATTVTYTFTDSSNNESTCSFEVFVEDSVEFAATVEIQGSIADDLTRCVTFTFCKSDNTTLEYQAEMDFDYSTGIGSLVVTDLPCGEYTCVTAQDTLHTLTVRLDLGMGFNIAGSRYEADFTGENLLLQGDLYDDTPNVGVDFIDVVDIGVYIAVWGSEYDSNGDSYPDGNTPCGMFNAHADVDGDGLIDTSDYAFITTNYELVGDMLCCSPLQALDGPQPRQSITVAELRTMGLGFVARADLNRDGKVDMRDVRAFNKGMRPDSSDSLIGDTREFKELNNATAGQATMSRIFPRKK